MDRQAAMAFIFSLWVSVLSSGAHAAEKLPVFVSIVPQKYFVEKIGGGAVDVEVMVQPGASPATYEPKPSQMRKLAGSAAYFAIGVPFEEAWLDRIAGVNPNMAGLIFFSKDCSNEAGLKFSALYLKEVKVPNLFFHNSSPFFMEINALGIPP